MLIKKARQNRRNRNRRHCMVRRIYFEITLAQSCFAYNLVGCSFLGTKISLRKHIRPPLFSRLTFPICFAMQFTSGNPTPCSKNILISPAAWRMTAVSNKFEPSRTGIFLHQVLRIAPTEKWIKQIHPLSNKICESSYLTLNEFFLPNKIFLMQQNSQRGKR